MIQYSYRGAIVSVIDGAYFAAGTEYSSEAACHQSIDAVLAEDEPSLDPDPDPWTLYDLDHRRVWGGEFKSEGQAYRWRLNAGLPPSIQPRRVSEIACGAPSSLGKAQESSPDASAGPVSHSGTGARRARRDGGKPLGAGE